MLEISRGIKTMIKLIPIYKNYVALEAIAFWRNETLHTLRTTEPTTTGQENFTKGNFII